MRSEIENISFGCLRFVKNGTYAFTNSNVEILMPIQMFTKMIPFFLKKIHRKSQMNKNEIIFQNRYFQQGRYLNDANKNLVAITYSLRIKAKYIYMNICIGMTPSIVSMSSHFNGPSLNFCLTFESSTKKKLLTRLS